MKRALCALALLLTCLGSAEAKGTIMLHQIRTVQAVAVRHRAFDCGASPCHGPSLRSRSLRGGVPAAFRPLARMPSWRSPIDMRRPRCRCRCRRRFALSPFRCAFPLPSAPSLSPSLSEPLRARLGVPPHPAFGPGARYRISTWV